MKDVSTFFKNHNFTADIDVEALLAEFDRQMVQGLEGKGGSLKMIPAYVDADKEVPTESPIIVLDAGKIGPFFVIVKVVVPPGDK